MRDDSGMLPLSYEHHVCCSRKSWISQMRDDSGMLPLSYEHHVKSTQGHHNRPPWPRDYDDDVDDDDDDDQCNIHESEML